MRSMVLLAVFRIGRDIREIRNKQLVDMLEQRGNYSVKIIKRLGDLEKKAYLCTILCFIKNRRYILC